MPIQTAPLLDPLTVKAKELRNRIVMPPMVVLRGLTTPEGIEWYGRRAQGGVGLANVEATHRARFGSELTAENLKPLVEAIHDGGALAAIQLFPRAASNGGAPAELTRAAIDELIAAYRTAASICAQAGFDGVEPHGAHGFLLNQFFSPVKNERTDDFGGPLENRMRIALAIVQATRDGLGEEGILLYRHTPVGEGYGMEDSLVLAERLVEAGVDVLDISPSSIGAPGDRAEPFRRFGVPVIAVGKLDQPARALEALTEGRADLVAIARGLIADPDWPAKVRENRLDALTRCTYCNACFDYLRQGKPVGCTQWA